MFVLRMGNRSKSGSFTSTGDQGFQIDLLYLRFYFN
jgi:hypothetical protein